MFLQQCHVRSQKFRLEVLDPAASIHRFATPSQPTIVDWQPSVLVVRLAHLSGLP